MMRLLLLLLLFSAARPTAAADRPAVAVLADWSRLYVQIRDYRVDPARARQQLEPLHAELRALYRRPGIGGNERVFPVAGYDPGCGEQGRAYRPKGYRFYTGNPQGIHPSLDLFVRDRDQDTLDDRSREPVPVVAFSGGIVVAVNTVWKPGDEQRGGLYVWVYDPVADRYVYYAHLATIDVRPGQILRAGDRIGRLGRSGRNAWKKRSPTHLHLMVLAWQNGAMQPVNPWPELLSARLLSLGGRPPLSQQ